MFFEKYVFYGKEFLWISPDWKEMDIILLQDT